MIPDPSRVPLRHPLAAADLAPFCHPRCRTFGRVVRHPETRAVVAANGGVALRLTRGPAIFDDEIPAAPPEFVARFDRLPWGRIERSGGALAPAPSARPARRWGHFDDVRGDLYRYGIEELWSPAGKLATAKPVWTADEMHVPLAILQLVARLPAAQVASAARDYLLFRFAGGEGVIANRYAKIPASQVPAHIFSIFR